MTKTEFIIGKYIWSIPEKPNDYCERVVIAFCDLSTCIISNLNISELVFFGCLIGKLSIEDSNIDNLRFTGCQMIKGGNILLIESEITTLKSEFSNLKVHDSQIEVEKIFKDSSSDIAGIETSILPIWKPGKKITNAHFEKIIECMARNPESLLLTAICALGLKADTHRTRIRILELLLPRFVAIPTSYNVYFREYFQHLLDEEYFTENELNIKIFQP